MEVDTSFNTRGSKEDTLGGDPSKVIEISSFALKFRPTSNISLDVGAAEALAPCWYGWRSVASSSLFCLWTRPKRPMVVCFSLEAEAGAIAFDGLMENGYSRMHCCCFRFSSSCQKPKNGETLPFLWLATCHNSLPKIFLFLWKSHFPWSLSLLSDRLPPIVHARVLFFEIAAKPVAVLVLRVLQRRGGSWLFRAPQAFAIVVGSLVLLHNLDPT